jgi:hypothetical protein
LPLPPGEYQKKIFSHVYIKEEAAEKPVPQEKEEEGYI